MAPAASEEKADLRNAATIVSVRAACSLNFVSLPALGWASDATAAERSCCIASMTVVAGSPTLS
ncbi:hypothetical protein amrb99_85670 [Actinomadura sp. RB99]|nr:hypothetical protein [Actinomadura sp. RB99]